MGRNITTVKVLIVFGVIGVIAIFLVVVLLLSSTSENKQLPPDETQEQPALPSTFAPPVSFPTFTPTPTPLPPISMSREEMIKQMPVSTDTFNIEYLYTIDEFIVMIKESPYEGNKLRAEAWFQERGITDFTTFRVVFTKQRWVQ